MSALFEKYKRHIDKVLCLIFQCWHHSCLRILLCLTNRKRDSGTTPWVKIKMLPLRTKMSGSHEREASGSAVTNL
jgi:hypothetical protein